MRKTFDFEALDDHFFVGSGSTTSFKNMLSSWSFDKAGALAELLLLSRSGLDLPRLADLSNGAASNAAMAAFRRSKAPINGDLSEFVSLRYLDGGTIDADWIRYTTNVRERAIRGGVPRSTAYVLSTALDELAANCFEHSTAPNTAFAGYVLTSAGFEIVVADAGVGVLESLRSCADYTHLADDAEALKLAVQEGVSRHGKDIGRGLGFRPLFTAMLNLDVTMRFRSGSAALVIDPKADEPSELLHRPFVRGLSVCFEFFKKR